MIICRICREESCDKQECIDKLKELEASMRIAIEERILICDKCGASDENDQDIDIFHCENSRCGGQYCEHCARMEWNDDYGLFYFCPDCCSAYVEDLENFDEEDIAFYKDLYEVKEERKWQNT